MSSGHLPTIDAAIDRALTAYSALTELGEDVADEWSYVTDLSAAWRDRFEVVATARAGESISIEVDAAIDRAIQEIDLISDAHRAIDWLSTFPQVVLVALGEAT